MVPIDSLDISGDCKSWCNPACRPPTLYAAGVPGRQCSHRLWRVDAFAVLQCVAVLRAAQPQRMGFSHSPNWHASLLDWQFRGNKGNRSNPHAEWLDRIRRMRGRTWEGRSRLGGVRVNYFFGWMRISIPHTCRGSACSVRCKVALA